MDFEAWKNHGLHMARGGQVASEDKLSLNQPLLYREGAEAEAWKTHVCREGFLLLPFND